jgi:possible nucleoside-diphosphate-sugar epimerase
MILVTGATGILGRVLILELLKRGKSVRAAKRPSSNLTEVRHSLKFYDPTADELLSRVEWVDLDLFDEDSLRSALRGVSEIYHCAAKVSFHPRDKEEMLRTNVQGTRNLLLAADEMGIQRFLFVSSIAALDTQNASGEVDESSEYDSSVSHSGYALSKYLSEMEVWRAAAEGMGVIIINPGIIIGSGNWNASSGTLFSQLGDNAFTFSGGTAYIDVRDTAKIAVELMEKSFFGERFILVAENRRFKDLADRIRKALGRSETLLVPAVALKIGYILNLLLGWLVPSLKIVNKANISAATDFVPLSNKKVKELLGWDFIPINESIDFHLSNYLADKTQNELNKP